MRHFFFLYNFAFFRSPIYQKFAVYRSNQDRFFCQFCSLSLSTLPEKCGRLFHPFVLKSGQKIALLIAHQTPLKAFGSGYAEKEHCRCNRFLCIFAGGFQRKRTLDEEKK